MGSNEAESKSPLQPANTANVADSLPPATPPLFALRRGDSSPRLAVASRKRALGSPSLGSFFFCRRTGRHPARIAVHRSSRTVSRFRRSLRRRLLSVAPSVPRTSYRIDYRMQHPDPSHRNSFTTIDPNVSRETFGSQPKQTAPTFALIRRGILISPQEQQSSKKKRHRKAASIESHNTAATFCRNRVNLLNPRSISAPETHQL